MTDRPITDLRLDDPLDRRELARRMFVEFHRLNCEARNLPADTPLPSWMALSDADLDQLLAKLKTLRPDDAAVPH